MANAMPLITTAEVGEILHVSEQAVRTWCRLGILPATRPPGTRKWLIARADFETWLHEGTGERVAVFLDGSNRSSSSEEELLSDANASLDRMRTSGARGRSKASVRATKTRSRPRSA
jgi:excisionase family DNA binding protein